MSISWQDLDAVGQQATEQAFVLASVSSELVVGAEAASGKIAPSTLFAIATGSLSRPEGFSQSLLRSPELRADYEAMLTSSSISSFERVAAASTGSLVEERIADGFAIRLVASRTAADLVYIMVQLAAGSEAPARLVAVGEAGDSVEVALDEPIEGVIQFQENTSSELVQLLRNPTARLYLV